MGRFKASDNDETLDLLKIITTKNDEFFPIYFNTLNKIVTIADGALAEIMSEFCLEMITNYPTKTLRYFAYNQDMLLKYAQFLGYEFYFKNEGTSDLKMNFDEFQNFLKTKIDMENKTLEKTFNDFIENIEINIKEMN